MNDTGDRRVLELLGPSTGGIRRHVAALVRHLPDSGWQPEVAGPSGVMGDLVDDAAELDVAASPSSFARHPDRLARTTRRLRSLAEPAHVVHAHGLKAGLVAVAARTGRPLVLTVHNVVLDEVSGRSASVMRRVERAVIARADRVICGSAEIEAMFADLVAPERLRWISPAAPDPVPRRTAAEVRAALGIATDDQLVIAVTRLHPQKQLSLLIAAFDRIAEAHPRARLVVLGEGPMREALQRDIDGRGLSGRIMLAGVGEHPADEMTAADIVALSSTWEGVPLAAAEALQLGRPLVMTAVGTIGKQMALDGVGGIAVPVGDVDAFAVGLGSLLGDAGRRAALGVAGQALGERYRARRLVAEVAAVYGEVAAVYGEVAR